MKTKTLLIAAAALAAGVMSSQAQVYSQNIVGYANVVLHGQGKYTMVANPFDDGNGNQLTNILASLPAGSQVLVWNPGAAGFNTYSDIAGNWNGNPSLPPGVGFFVKNGKVTGSYPDITNTFVGSISVSAGGSATNDCPLAYTLQGSPIPYAGNLAVSGTAAGDTNFTVGASLPAGSQILLWDASSQGYKTYTKIAGTWNGTASVNVGDGFFIRNVKGPATNWVQNAGY